jgi:hypothetical protein
LLGDKMAARRFIGGSIRQAGKGQIRFFTTVTYRTIMNWLTMGG